MNLPLQQLHNSLGLGGDASGLVAAAHPSRAFVALARGSVLAVLPLQQQQQPGSTAPAGEQQQQAPRVPAHHSKHTYTALAWFVQLSARRSNGGSGHQQQDHHQQQQQQHPPDPYHYQQLLEAEVLLSGTADGHLQLHAPSGQLLFKQRLSTQPVQGVVVRPHSSGLASSEASEEVCVCTSNALMRISALDLRAHIRMLQLAQGGGPASAAVSVGPLPYIRYDLPAAIGPRVSGLSLGQQPADLWTLLSSSASAASRNSSSSAGGAAASRAGPGTKHKICLVTVGRNPCVAAFEADEHPSRSTLAALVGMASSLTSGVVGAARNVAGLGPSIMAAGVRSLVKPLASWVASSSVGAAAAALRAVQQQQQPIAAFEDLAAAPTPEALTLTRQLRDDERALSGLVPAPAGPLLVAPDNLGRVMLLDGADMVAVRVWKGYRDAQCGWLLPPPGHPAAPLGLLLVLHAPKRQVVEVWLPRAGQRLAVRVTDGGPCVLLGVGLPCGAWGNAGGLRAWQAACGPASTLVLHLQSGAVWDAMDSLLLDDAAAGGGAVT